jgi:ABC-type nitrate/sulfonate/bicarbonate transport system substrate-binding protein
MAIDAMKNDGYDATGQQLASEDLMYQGLSANTVQLATGGLSQVARAVDQGVPVKAVDTRNSSDTVYVAANDYQDCSKLAGKPVGIYAPKAIFTLFMELYFDQHCKGVAYTPVTIADSALRAQAMEQGQILATVLGLPDAIALNARKPGQFYMVAFGKELPGIADSYLIANTTTLADHPSIVDAFVREHMTAIRTLYTADDSTLTSLLKQYLPKVTDLTVMKGLLADKLFYTNGGLAGDGLDQSLKAFKLPSDRAHIIDDGPVNRALAVLGQSDLTTR